MDRQHIARAVRACRNCVGLNTETTPSAPLWGGITPTILFVGQSLHGALKGYPPAPGADVLKTQVPFLCASGVPLSNLFTSFGWPPITASPPPPDSPYALTNLVHCHPPMNKFVTPAAERRAAENCKHHLHSELSYLASRKLRCVIAIGSQSRDAIAARYGDGIQPRRNQLSYIDVNGTRLVFGHIVHPSAALRMSEGDPSALPKWAAAAGKLILSAVKVGARQ